MHLVSFKNPTEAITLGRGHECQIRLTDISVSRIHAHFRLENGRFLIFDNVSKFGTLIKIQNSIPITEERAAIQVGRTVVICCLRTEKKRNSTGEGSLKRIK